MVGATGLPSAFAMQNAHVHFVVEPPSGYGSFFVSQKTAVNSLNPVALMVPPHNVRCLSISNFLKAQGKLLQDRGALRASAMKAELFCVSFFLLKFISKQKKKMHKICAPRIYHMVGATGFEPATSWSQTTRSSQTEPCPVQIIIV